MSTSSTDRCPQCGAPLAAGAVQAPCPACLLQLGLLANHDTPDGAAGVSRELGPTHISPPAHRYPSIAKRLPSPTDLAKLFPELEITRLLGFGGMGAVYQAKQTGLDRYVALKIIMPDVAGDPGFAERFTREARVLARLSHPHIVTIHDFGQRAGLHFLIMEYVDGVNLREVLNAGPMSPQEAFRIIPRLCEALQYAHEEGIVHRDIKPENILIDRKGRVKVADFGLARLAGRDSENYTLTGTRQVVGTPRYMAPEQMQGSRAVDHRADIYSLGVVFYEMLTGEVPIGRFPPPSHQAAVDVRLDDVVLRALDSNPDHRYQRVSEIQSDVESISQGGGLAAPPTRDRTPALTSDGETAADPTVPAVFLLVIGAVQAIVSLGITVLTLSASSPGSFVILGIINVLGVLGAGTGLIAIAGATHSLASGSTRWLRIGAVMMMFPLSIAWLAGMPIGLWVLLATSSHRKARPARKEASHRSWQLQVIAIVQLILGFVQFLAVPIAFWFLLTQGTSESGASIGPGKLLLVMVLLMAAAGVTMVISAAGYLAGGSSRWLLTGAIIMLVPTGMTWIISLPVGLWALIALYQESQGPRVVPAVDLPRPPIPPVPPPPRTDAAHAPEQGRASEQTFVPWSGFGWVQKAVRNVPNTQRRGLFYAAALIAIVAVWIVLLFMANAGLQSAAKSGNTYAVRFWLLIGAGMNGQDSQGMTPLMWAVWTSRPDVVQQLLAAGADVHMRAEDGETALMKACYVGRRDIVGQLLSRKAFVNEMDQDGETALALAASQGHLDIVRMLLEHQADTHIATDNGWTPLIAAAAHGHDPVVNLLLPFSSINATDRIGNTALIKAAASGHPECVQTLINGKADLNITNAEGATALGAAIAGGYSGVINLLVTKGATSNLLPFYQGFQAGSQGQFTTAIDHLKTAAQSASAIPLPWRIGLRGWRYEIRNPSVFIAMLIAECERAKGDFAAAKASLEAALAKIDSTTQSVDLYHRRNSLPQQTITDQISVSVSELRAQIDRQTGPWRLFRDREEIVQTANHSRGSSSSQDIAVKSLFE